MQLQDVAESTRLGPLSGEVRAGEILHLVGPNGAGKSTLLARMAGMTSGKGSIQFAGQPLEAWSATKLALHRAYLSQQQTPPFAMPVWHYLTLHQHDKTRTELLNDVAGALALDDKLGRSTNQLSRLYVCFRAFRTFSGSGRTRRFSLYTLSSESGSGGRCFSYLSCTGRSAECFRDSWHSLFQSNEEPLGAIESG